MNAELPPKQAVQEAPSKPFVVERLPKSFRPRIAQYIHERDAAHDRFNFGSIFLSSEEYQNRKFVDDEYRRRGLSRSDHGLEFAETFAAVYEKIQAAGFDGSPQDILLRWISVDEGAQIEKIIIDSESNGGMIATTEAGLNMSDRSGRVDKAFSISIRNGQAGVLFIYDGRKMQRLSKKEEDTNTNFAAGWGRKPQQNETYRSALLGLVALP